MCLQKEEEEERKCTRGERERERQSEGMREGIPGKVRVMCECVCGPTTPHYTTLNVHKQIRVKLSF